MAQTWIIQGVTTHGHLFRPTDWAERLAGQLCTMHMRMLRYSPYLYPTVYGTFRSLYVDGVLGETHPHLYADLKAFADHNDLQVILMDSGTIAD